MTDPQNNKNITYKCQICESRVTPERYKELDTLSPIWELSPARFKTCSHHCLAKAHQLEGCFKMRKRLKNLSSFPYSVFQDIFGFDEAGGYAENMYRKCRTSEFDFICSLDDKNFAKLINVDI